VLPHAVQEPGESTSTRSRATDGCTGSRFPLRRGDLLSSWTSLRQRMGTPNALVAQGIERLPPEQKAVGSNPIEGTTKPRQFKELAGFFFGSPPRCCLSDLLWQQKQMEKTRHVLLPHDYKILVQTSHEEPSTAFPELDANAPVLARKLSRLPPAQLATILRPNPKDTDARM
jgi:hypothetical protein